MTDQTSERPGPEQETSGPVVDFTTAPIETRALIEYGTRQEITALYTALGMAQGEFPDIPRGATGRTGHQTYKYATLATILKCIRPALAKHGLAVVQPYATGQHSCQITTVLAHSGGGRLESTSSFVLPGEIKDFGSSRTYMARYALTSMLVVDADADADELPENAPITGQAQPEPRQQRRQETPRQRNDKPATERPTQQPADKPAPSGPPADKATFQAIRELVDALHWNAAAIKDHCHKTLGVSPDAFEQPGGQQLADQWIATLKDLIQ